MDKKTNITLRISIEEKNQIRNKAEESGLQLSQYMRKMCLDGVIIKIENEDRKTLSGIANNLNQLTRYTNQTHVLPPELTKTLTLLLTALRYAYRKR